MEASTGEEFDPSYLRLIRDRLEGNAPGAAELAALPFGLSGAFDEELSRWPVMERRPLLLWFGVFALSSKAIRLEWAESVLRVFDPHLSLDTEPWRSAFSQKFNSAEPGEYALYHERFGSFVLQSIGQADVERLNAAIIQCCREAMEGPVDSFGTRYALRHGADHHLLVASWKQDAGELEDWLLNEEVWSAQFRLEGNWAVAMEGCRIGLKTVAKLKDRKRLTQFAVALRQLTVRDEDCAEEALNLFREGRVEEAVQRVWNWDDDRLMIWVCLVLFDAKGLREDVTPMGGKIKAIHALFSLLETRCSRAQANQVYPVDHLFGLLRWLNRYGLSLDWLMQRMSYTWDNLRDEFRDGRNDHLSIQFLVSALRAGKGDMLRTDGLLRMGGIKLIFVESLQSGNDEVLQLFLEQLTPSLIVKFLGSHLQSLVSERMKQQQLISLSRVHHCLAALDSKQSDEALRFPLGYLEVAFRSQRRKLPQPEEAGEWLSVFQEVVELLLSTDDYVLAGGTPDEMGRLVQILLHDAGWGVLMRMGADSPLFKVLYKECALASGNANAEQRETWNKLTVSSWTQEEAEERLLKRNSFGETTTVKQPDSAEGDCNRVLDPIVQLEAIAQRCKEENLWDVHQLEELGFDAVESLNGLAIRYHSDLEQGVGPPAIGAWAPACDLFAEYMMLAYAKAQEYSVSLSWIKRFSWSHRPQLAWEAITKVPITGHEWHAWKSDMLGLGRRSLADMLQTRRIPHSTKGQEVFGQCVDLVFRCCAFDQQDFVTTVLSGLAIGQYQVAEFNLDQASLYISNRTMQRLSMKSENGEFMTRVEQYLSGDEITLNSWEVWISKNSTQLQAKAHLRHVALMCFDLGRYDFCLALVEKFDVAAALSENTDLFSERKFRGDEWRPIQEEMLRILDFRTFVWHQVSRVEGEGKEELFLQLWDTKEGELEWGSDEFDQWKGCLDMLPAHIQYHVVKCIWVHMEAAAEVQKGLYANPRMRRHRPVRFSPGFWSDVIAVSLRHNWHEKVNWLLFQMGIKGLDQKGNPIQREVSRDSNAVNMLAGLVMSLSLREPLTVSLVERVLKDCRFSGHIIFGSEVLLLPVTQESCSVAKCGFLALNFAREMPVGRERGMAMSAFFSSREIIGDGDALIAAKGLNVQDEGLVHIIPAVVIEGEDWEYALNWLAVSDVNSACLRLLIQALAIGERWEQVTSPETAIRTPGLEELVDLGDWGYA